MIACIAVAVSIILLLFNNYLFIIIFSEYFCMSNKFLWEDYNSRMIKVTNSYLYVSVASSIYLIFFRYFYASRFMFSLFMLKWQR